MKYSPRGLEAVSQRIELSRDKRGPPAAAAAGSLLDPLRQAKRLPIRLIKMLTAHTGHLLHPEYLQPLTSAPVSIELDAKKSPLALLAQTCSQIGKPDPPCSKLSSSCGQGDKESSSRLSASGHKLGDHRPSSDDKSSFKPYNKGSGECRKDASGAIDKATFRGNGSNNASTNGGSSQPPHAPSPGCRTSGSTPPGQQHKQSHSPTATQIEGGEVTRGRGSPVSPGGVVTSLKKDGDVASKPTGDGAQMANSSHARATTNCSTSSSEGGVNPDKPEPAQPSLGPQHITPISPFKSSQSLFPLPPSSIGYQGSVMGGYPGYQFAPSLDPSKSGLGGMGGKHPSSSPLTGASPPSFMQGLCRDPYCLSYPSMSQLGGSSCNSCIHDPSSTLKSSFPMVYPPHPLHSLHQSSLSPGVSSSLPHPLYSYGFMLPNDPLPHACNWVSVGGPCDKRFATSEELLSHLRTHTALPVSMDSKLLSISSSGPASCHIHLPHQTSPSSMPSPLSLRGPPSLGLARYHPYSKVHLPSGPSSISLPGPYYPHYTFYSQRLGSASALGYQ